MILDIVFVDKKKKVRKTNGHIKRNRHLVKYNIIE